MPWMAIMPDGTVGIAYMDTVLSPNTWGPLSRVGDLLTDGTVLSQSLSVKGPGDAAWTSTLLTDLPSPADATGFWGDYQGLAATSKGFHPAFGDARESYLSGGQNADMPDFGTMHVSPSLVVPVP